MRLPLTRRSRSDAASPTTAPSPAEVPLVRSLDRLEQLSALDRVISPLQRVVQALPLGPARDVLHGRQLGHPLHPALVLLPMGTWLSGSLLDLLPGRERAARTLVGAGVLAAGPAALAGWVDWAEQHEQQKRTGLVHAATNIAALTLYGGSWAARVRGRYQLGRSLGWAGLCAAGAGGLLGGHLAYRQGAGPNKTEPVPHLLEPDWYDLGPLRDLPTGRPVRRLLGEVPVLLVREEDDRVHALADRCSHLSGPLSDGEIADGCVTCPWHGSVFRLSDGWNVKGPATAPQPCFETRTAADGRLQVRLPGAG